MAQVRERFRVELDHGEALRSLAAKTMEIWFARKGNNGFLEQELHPLGKFCEEIGPRTHNALEALVPEYKPKADKPLQTPEEIRAERAEKAAKRAEEELSLIHI